MRMHRRFLASLIAAIVVTASACGSDDPAGPGLGDGDFTATIDGDDWSANVGAVATRNNNIIGLGAGDSDGLSMGIGFVDAGVGTYPINGTSATNALLTEDGKTWVANSVTGGSGTLTITAIDGSHVAGTFSFTAVPSAGSGATGERAVTNGEFDVEFQAAP